MATAEQDSASASSSQDIEEGRDAYKPGGFHPVYIGDVYHDRYKVLNKIGFGVYSTVWLVRDLQASPETPSPKYLALKILTSSAYGTEKDIFELEILHHLRAQNKEQIGYTQICHLLDDFEHVGPNGTHVCLVFELIGETLRSFSTWFPDYVVPNVVMRHFTIQLLMALDFAHDHNVIHTDIQPKNIFVRMRDYSLIESGYLVEVPIPEQDKAEERYTVIPSRPLRYYYFNDGDKFNLFDIVLGDWGVATWTDNHLTETIQPVALRAPEVLIGAPWGPAVDMWNLGAVVLEVFCAIRMFCGVGLSGGYELERHLEEIVHYCGPFPKSLLDGAADQDVVGSIFDDGGEVRNRLLSPESPDFGDERFTPGLREGVREEFVEFLGELMKIDPVERPLPE
ncbi:hypothetical protein V492_08182, partial [Pseudogymnoascus sp. VKM F-4246]